MANVTLGNNFDFKYKTGDIEYCFRRISVEDAYKMKNLFMVLSDNQAKFEDKEKAQEKFDKFFLKYLVIKGKSGEPLQGFSDISMLDEMFKENPFMALNISKTFTEEIMVFMKALENYQGLKTNI